jgi:hypothetical protein
MPVAAAAVLQPRNWEGSILPSLDTTLHVHVSLTTAFGTA